MKFDRVSYAEVIGRDLRVADTAAFSLCMENELPIIVFNLLDDGNIARVVRGEKIGTLVSSMPAACGIRAHAASQGADGAGPDEGRTG